MSRVDPYCFREYSYGMGRPKSAPGTTRSIPLPVRLTEDERRLFQAAAALAEPPRDFSQWVRDTLYDEAKRLGATKGAPSVSPERPAKRRQRAR